MLKKRHVRLHVAAALIAPSFRVVKDKTDIATVAVYLSQLTFSECRLIGCVSVLRAFWGSCKGGNYAVKSYCPDKRDLDFVLRLLMPENRLVMRIAILTGLRVDDVLSIKTESLYKDRFTILEKKTGKRRVIRLPKALKAECVKCAGQVFVFPHRDDGFRHRTRSAVWKDIKRAAVALRIPDNITPHSARKFYAQQLYEATDNDLFAVQKALNHSSPETTFIYYLSQNIPDKCSKVAKTHKKNAKK